MKNIQTPEIFEHHPNWWRDDTVSILGALLSLDWKIEILHLFGKKIPSPRCVLWMGDPGITYRYSGVDHVASGWHPLIASIRDKLKASTGIAFNSVLGNLYRDGNDYMGWHCDNEKTLGPQPTIASVSFGATRPFVFKHKKTKEKHKLVLTSGSLLIMKNQCQDEWLHTLPKVAKLTEPRVNLTFRKVFNM